MPYVCEIIDKMNGPKYFSKVDMATAYWAVPVRESDRHKTAFMTPRGLSGMCMIAYGLCRCRTDWVFRGWCCLTHRIVWRNAGGLWTIIREIERQIWYWEQTSVNLVITILILSATFVWKWSWANQRKCGCNYRFSNYSHHEKKTWKIPWYGWVL